MGDNQRVICTKRTMTVHDDCQEVSPGKWQKVIFTKSTISVKEWRENIWPKRRDIG